MGAAKVDALFGLIKQAVRIGIGALNVARIGRFSCDRTVGE